MRLAIIDEHKLATLSPEQREVVLLSWSHPDEARSALAERVAQKLAPNVLQRRRRRRAATAVDQSLSELLDATRSL